MDESWRMRMGGTPPSANDPRRRSTEDCRRMISGDHQSSIMLQPQDFNDVFGGPPRIVIARQLSSSSSVLSGMNNPGSFYDAVFQQPEDLDLPGTLPTRGRNLPEFKIPAEKGGRRSDQGGFYSDIFGWDNNDEGDDEVMRRLRTRSGSKSKSSSTASTSAFSSEELSPLQAATGGRKIANDDVSVFASRLRPINIPSRWTSSKMLHEEENDRQQEEMAATGEFPWSYLGINQPNERMKSSNNSGYRPGNSSPETISIVPDYSYGSVRLGGSDDYLEHNSPLSPVSIICQEDHKDVPACKTHDEMLVEDHDIEQDEDDDDDEVMNSYVIEINSDYRDQTDDAIGVDDAIAWAKEKFQNCPESTCKDEHKPEKQSADAVEEIANLDHQVSDRQKIDTHGSSDDTTSQMEMEQLEETVKLWSSGKESDIRFLLSTLHHILWPNSGWVPALMTTLIESAHVKKAYQKARLCLHPDKLQQRGATLPQKYIAEKAFSILQDAWAAFISRDVSMAYLLKTT